jgi:acyl carrier protein
MKKNTKRILKKVLGNKVKINDKTDINNTISWDSLSHIKIILEIEKSLKKKLKISQVINLTSVKKIDKLFIK